VNSLLRAIHLAAQCWRGVAPLTTPVRVAYVGGPAGSQVTRWTFDRQRYGDQVRIEFSGPEQMRRFGTRWRDLARAIHVCGREDPEFRFEDVPIHFGDGVFFQEPQDVLGFARRTGASIGLIPNTYLLGPRPSLPAPLAWERKTDTLYFRGASTGAVAYEENARVRFCRAARAIPGSDCRISKLRQIDGDFARRLAAEGLVARPDPLRRLNRHRFLADVDGNTSSWDRYLMIGLFGGVPIRFEPAWEECWHDLLVDGETCVVVDRDTLPEVVARLRANDRIARRIAENAREIARIKLTPEALRQRLRQALAAARNQVV